MHVDEKSEKTAHQVLIILFIVIIVLINLEFLIRYIYLNATRCLKNSGHCIRISSAMGSIFLALFSLVVLARINFDEYKSMSCRTIMIAGVYNEMIFPFVYGCGLVLQGLSLYLDHSRFYTSYVSQWNLQKVFLAFILPAAPWILGLTVMCPLAMAGTKWDDNCSQSISRARNLAMLIVGIFLPAFMALLSSIVIHCTLRSATFYHNTRTSSDESLLDAGNDYTLQDPTEMISVSGEVSSNTTYNSALPRSDAPGDLPDNRNVYFLQRSQVVASEKRCLIWSSLIFFLSVMPKACYALFSFYIFENMDPPSYIVIIFEICYWTFFLYPALVPIVWRRQIRV